MVYVKNFLNKNKYLVLILLSFLFILIVSNPVDPDVYWHIKSGESILTYGIPHQDSFSYWDTSFTAHEWLFDIIVYGSYYLWGYLGVTFLKNFIVILSLLVAIKTCEKKISFSVYILPLILYVYCNSVLIARPHILSLLLFVIEIYILENNKNIWFVPLLTLLCANIHGAFCIILVFTYIFYYIIKELSHEEINIKKSLYVLCLSLISMAITPYGVKSVTYAFKIPSYVTELITEYSPFIKGPKEIIFLMIGLLPFVCMAYIKNAKTIDIGMISFGFCMMLTWTRFVIIFVPLYIIFGCKYIDEALKKIIQKNKLDFNINDRLKSVLRSMSAGLIIIFILLSGYMFINIEPFNESKKYSAPVIIKEYIEKNGIDVKNDVMFNDYNFGGYFIFNNIPVFIDGRCDPYLAEFGGVNILPDYLDILNVKNNILELIDKYNIKYFAIYKESKLAEYLVKNNLGTVLISDEKYEFLKWNGG